MLEYSSNKEDWAAARIHANADDQFRTIRPISRPNSLTRIHEEPALEMFREDPTIGPAIFNTHHFAFTIHPPAANTAAQGNHPVIALGR
jgi:hypothetical protein